VATARFWHDHVDATISRGAMRVLMLAESYVPIVGGVERIVEELSEELSRRGHEVSVATLRQPGEGDAASSGITVHMLGSLVHRVPGMKVDQERNHAPPVADPETTRELRRVLHQERPDVVHAHNWIVNSYLPLERRGTGPGLVLSMHDYGLVCATKRFLNRGADCTGPHTGKCVRCATDYYGRLRGTGIALATRRAEPRLRRGVDVFLPVSSAVRDRCGLDPADPSVRIVPNFVGELPTAPPEGDPRLDSIPDEPFILYFGDVTVDKGGRQLLEAYRALDDPPPLVLVGRCYLPEVERVPGVVAPGPLPHRLAIEVLRHSMFTVAPSLVPETFGLVALETASAGKAIVASQIGGLTDIVVDGETGILIRPGARGAMTDAMARLLGDDGLRERMGAAARERAGQFSPDAVVPQFEAAYRQAVELRSGRAAAAAG
jgi:glycosyltransferase involved in cell wall biosynthesis